MVGNIDDTVDDVITDRTTGVINLAAVPSGGAEANFELGYSVNVLGLRRQLERCREDRGRPRHSSGSRW